MRNKKDAVTSLPYEWLRAITAIVRLIGEHVVIAAAEEAITY